MSVRAPSESATPAVEEQICPQCGGGYPVQAGFVPWCDRCGWGLKPPALPRARSPFAKLYVEAGRRAGGALLAEMRRGPVGRPRLTPALAAAFALAVLVHGVTLGLVGLGVALLAGAWGYWIIVAVGLLCLGLAWVIRPRAPRLDAEDRDGLVTRAGFPPSSRSPIASRRRWARARWRRSSSPATSTRPTARSGGAAGRCCSSACRCSPSSTTPSA